MTEIFLNVLGLSKLFIRSLVILRLGEGEWRRTFWSKDKELEKHQVERVINTSLVIKTKKDAQHQ